MLKCICQKKMSAVQDWVFNVNFFFFLIFIFKSSHSALHGLKPIAVLLFPPLPSHLWTAVFSFYLLALLIL